MVRRMKIIILEPLLYKRIKNMGKSFTLLYKKCYFPNWARNAGGYALIGGGLQNDQNLKARTAPINR